MNILVYDNDNKDQNKINENEKILISKEGICPECGVNIIINVKDYKISYECKNGHKKNNISFNEFINSQKTKNRFIKNLCNKCKNEIKKNKEFYFCSICQLYFCILCKGTHDKNHIIINYKEKNYLCKNHSDSFIKYWKGFKENICLLCRSDEKHDIINLSDIMINKNFLLKESDKFKIIIDKFKNEVEKIRNILNNIVYNIEIYYEINIEIIFSSSLEDNISQKIEEKIRQ